MLCRIECFWHCQKTSKDQRIFILRRKRLELLILITCKALGRLWICAETELRPPKREFINFIYSISLYLRTVKNASNRNISNIMKIELDFLYDAGSLNTSVFTKTVTAFSALWKKVCKHVISVTFWKVEVKQNWMSQLFIHRQKRGTNKITAL